MSAGVIPRIRAASSRLRAARPLDELDVQPAGCGVGEEPLAPPPVRALHPARSSPPGSRAADDSVAVEQQGFALAAAAAQRDGGLAGAPALEFVGRVQGQPGTGGADRVAQGDGAAVDVALLQRVVEVLQRLHRHGAEGLVDLDEVQVGGRTSRPCPGRS